MAGQPAPPPPPSIVWRVVLAIALTVAFYAGVLAAVALIVDRVWHRYQADVAGIVDLLLLLLAAFVLYSILPRFDTAQPDGPRVDRADHPRLFHLIESVARATDQAMPVEVFMDWDANAAVFQRGSWLGVGGRRAMVLGLPLLQMLSISELRGAIAHEFGHYHGGDTRLAPLVYRASDAVLRTIRTLGYTPWGFLFNLYGRLFLRVTMAISRRQELAADALAVVTVGREPVRAGLEKADVAAAAAQSFWLSEVVPILNEGWRPPLGAGFAAFLDSSDVQEDLAKVRAETLAEEDAATYDSHPATPVRLAAIEALPTQPPLLKTDAGDERPALTLLDDPAALERPILEAIGGAEDSAALKPIAWSEIGSTVYLPMYEQGLQLAGELLQGITPADIPGTAAEHETLGMLAGARTGQRLEGEEARQTARSHYASAMVVALQRSGFDVDIRVGKAVRCRRDEIELRPFNMLEELADGSLDPDAFRQQVRDAGIADMDLGSLVSPAPPPPQGS